jgi:murein DD-endopeptidase MepM/ murein hydrolase activator NlpD
MKQWTVMLIPHDRGNTRTLTLTSLHLWVPVVVCAALAFTSAFFYQRNSTTQAYLQEVQEAKRALELENARKPAVVETKTRSEDETKALEARLRAEYEASLAKITAELGELYEMESKARDITGLAPRRAAVPVASTKDGKGKGGPAVGIGGLSLTRMPAANRPDFVIYGMSRPSADLIVQEIALRTSSFGDLVQDMAAEQDRIQRIPSVWPLAGRAGTITSRYGHRVDPFTRRVRHHDGTDISAKPGTRILATAKGRVIHSAYDSDYGNLVKIDHGNGIQTWYAHMTRRIATEGQVVDRETVIGTVGSTGRSTGPHLHYEVHVRGRSVDPQKYLSK